MKELITELFLQNNFRSLVISDFTLFFHPEECRKKEFWVIVESQGEDILERQAEISILCKSHNLAPELEKNSSLVVIQRVDDEISAQSHKSAALMVEEDPYFFKKYVLMYSTSELTELKEKQENESINVFLTSAMLQPSCFAHYKMYPKSLCWQSLVYRLANKLPFIEINISTSKGLKPLFDSNKSKVIGRGLQELNDAVQSVDLVYNKEEMNALDPKDLLDILDPLKKDNDEN